MPNDSLNSLTWKAESLKDLKYCSFWGAIICDLISYAFKKNVEAILCRRAKWVTKWTFTIGGKKFHITIKVVNVIQRNMRWVLTGNVWESHLSSLCSLQPQDLRLDFCCCKWWDLEVSCQCYYHINKETNREERHNSGFYPGFYSGLCLLQSQFSELPLALSTATNHSKTDLTIKPWRSNLNKRDVQYG